MPKVGLLEVARIRGRGREGERATLGLLRAWLKRPCAGWIVPDGMDALTGVRCRLAGFQETAVTTPCLAFWFPAKR
jgi:hypothetical protein